MPRRLFSRKKRWIALVSSAWPLASLPPPESLGPPTLTSPERFARLIDVEVAPPVEQRARLLLPHSHHLRSLFLQCHPRQEVRHALLGAQARIAVVRHPLSLGGSCRPGRRRGVIRCAAVVRSQGVGQK